MKKKYLVITGGAGFVGSNLISLLLKKTNYKIISLDNYSTGNKKNHIKDKRVKYLKSDTKIFQKLLKNIKIKFNHFFILVSLQEFTKVF